MGAVGWAVRAAAPLLAIAAVSCAGHLPPCPAAGGPVWIEIQSPHFRLRTDLNGNVARVVLADLEQLEAALLTVFGVSPDVDMGKVPVVVVKHGWTALTSFRVEGYAGFALFQPLVVMVAGGQLQQQEVIKHELVHYLTALVMPRQPRWFAEGLATYFETIDVDDTGRITVGRLPDHRFRGALSVSTSTIESMFAATDFGNDASNFYAASWLTMHYLMNHRADALKAYEEALRRDASFETAWSAAFGAQTPAQVAKDVARYLTSGGKYAELIYRSRPYKTAWPVQRPLSDADAHATRALLYITAAGRGAGSAEERAEARSTAALAAKRELDEAFRQDPDHVAAWAILHWHLSAPIDLERAAAATRKNPSDWLAWLLLAKAHAERNDAAGREKALARATELARADLSIDFLGKGQPH
jgi:tetratricopeptide (TPR) repeat protein